MKFGVVIPTFGPYWSDPAVIKDALQAAEDSGVETAWFGDHIVVPEYATTVMLPEWHSVLSSMIFAAGMTSRIRLASDVMVLAYRNPVELSQILASADQLSTGRLTLGVGVGYLAGEFTAVGAPPYAARGAVTDEYLDVLRLLWTSRGPVSFHGRWVEFENVYAAPYPFQDPLPILIGGNAGRTFERAALRGDGWHPLLPTPAVYRAGVEKIEEKRRGHGITRPFRYSASASLAAVLLDGEPIPERRTPRSAAPADFSYAPDMPHDGARPLLCGSPDQIVTDLEQYVDAGVESLVLRFWHYAYGELTIDDWIQQLDRFSQLVFPRLSDPAEVLPAVSRAGRNRVV